MKKNTHHEHLMGDIHRMLTVLLPQLKDPRIAESFLTVTRVSLTQDLSFCKVYVSVLGADADEILPLLKRASGHLRKELFASIKMRKSPELIFVKDDGAAYAERINDILRKTNEPAEDIHE